MKSFKIWNFDIGPQTSPTANSSLPSVQQKEAELFFFGWMWNISMQRIQQNYKDSFMNKRNSTTTLYMQVARVFRWFLESCCYKITIFPHQPLKTVSKVAILHMLLCICKSTNTVFNKIIVRGCYCNSFPVPGFSHQAM